MIVERWPYESEMNDHTMPVSVELMHDEIMAIVSLIHNKYGWTRDERLQSDIPMPLRVALLSMAHALQAASRMEED